MATTPHSSRNLSGMAAKTGFKGRIPALPEALDGALDERLPPVADLQDSLHRSTGNQRLDAVPAGNAAHLIRVVSGDQDA